MFTACTFFYDQLTVRTNFRRPRIQPIGSPSPRDLPSPKEKPSSSPHTDLKSGIKPDHKTSKVGSESSRKKSQLPEINQRVRILQNKLDSQQYLFEVAKNSAKELFKMLTLYLNKYKNIKDLIPQSLVYRLLCNYNDMTKTVEVPQQPWKTQVMQKKLEKLKGTVGNVKDRDTPSYKSKAARKVKTETKVLPGSAKKLRKIKSQRNVSVKPSVTSIKSGQNAQSDHGTGSSQQTVNGEVHIQFLLSSPTCETAWLVTKGDNTTDMRTELLWTQQILHNKRKQIEKEREENTEAGMDWPVQLVYYEEMKWVKKRRNVLKKLPEPRLDRGELPRIPSTAPEDQNLDLKIFQIMMNDNTTVTYYPSGQVAIVQIGKDNPNRQYYYTVVFEDTEQHTMLACFLPNGTGCCYYNNNSPRILFTTNGGHLLTDTGVESKEWSWPSKNGKLARSIYVQLNVYISLWCKSQFFIYLLFKYEKETTKVNLQLENLSQDKEKDSQSPTLTRNQRERGSEKSIQRKGLTSDEKLAGYRRELARLQKHSRSLVNNWMQYYQKVIGLDLQSKRGTHSAVLSHRKLLLLKDHRATLSAPARSQLASGKCLHMGPAEALEAIEHIAEAAHLKPVQKLQSNPDLEDPKPVKLPLGIACPTALRAYISGKKRSENLFCKCSNTKIPYITDMEYDAFIFNEVHSQQLIIIEVVSSHFPKSTPAKEMMEQIYHSINRDRTHPCVQSHADMFRLLMYDINTATNDSDHTQPLLLTRHNIVPGMFLIYLDGKLLFCDHIFNGYGNACKDFEHQILKCQKDGLQGMTLPHDFRFSPSKGPRGLRSAWGGEIGGTGVDGHGNPGILTDLKHHDLQISLSTVPDRGHNKNSERPISTNVSADHSNELHFDTAFPQIVYTKKK